MKINLGIKLKVSSYIEERDARPAHDLSVCWYGFGMVGKTRKGKSMPDIKVRRFLMVRDSLGITRYFYWTSPKRGSEAPRVYGFKKVRKLTHKESLKHFKRICLH